jgi:hypothetical protein
MNDWYKRDDYHRDHGEGLDCYRVGAGRGCGGLGVWKDGKLYCSRDFRKWKVLANGPVRVVFELTYDPWDAGGVKVSEVKRISLDVGTHFNRFQSILTSDGAESMTVGVGLGQHKDYQQLSNLENNWIGVWDKADTKGEDNGMVGTGLVFPPGAKVRFQQAGTDALLLTEVRAGQPLVYYAGAGWSKGGFPDISTWKAHIAEFATRLRSPLKVQIKP